MCVPTNVKDLTGKRFHMIIVTNYKFTKNGQAYWEIKCDCGNISVASGGNIRMGYMKSCGCLRKPHGLSNTRFYSIWRGMKRRCLNKNSKAYKRYGGRGIVVCEKWMDFIGFKEDMYESYLKHVEEYGEKNTTIERTDNFKGYFKENCIWADRKDQARNTRSNVNITYKGDTMCAMAWSDKLGINVGLITHRVREKVPLNDIFKKPISKNKKRLITYNNKTQCVSDWARELNILRPTLSSRLNNNWPIDKTLTVPPSCSNKLKNIINEK